jgi:hypothetical protein
LALASHHDKRAGGQHDADGLPSEAGTPWLKWATAASSWPTAAGPPGGSAPLHLAFPRCTSTARLAACPRSDLKISRRRSSSRPSPARRGRHWPPRRDQAQ